MSLDVLKDIEDIAGRAVALQLVREYGGLEIHVSDAEGSALVRLLGQEMAARLVAGLGRGKVTIPMAHLRGQVGRRVAATKMLAAGAPQNQVARACDIHERTARRVKARMAKARAQGLPLFPDD